MNKVCTTQIMNSVWSFIYYTGTHVDNRFIKESCWDRSKGVSTVHFCFPSKVQMFTVSPLCSWLNNLMA